jgi:hypothetical protein
VIEQNGEERLERRHVIFVVLIETPNGPASLMRSRVLVDPLIDFEGTDNIGDSAKNETCRSQKPNGADGSQKSE